MRRPSIVWRVPPGSIYRTTHGGTRLVVDKAKLRAKVQAAVRKQAAHAAPVRRAGPQPAGRPGPRGNPAARRAQAIEQMKNQPPERLLAGFISNGRLVWVRHPEEMKDYLVEPATGCMVIGFNGQPVTRSTRFSWKRVPLKMEILRKHLEDEEGRFRAMYPDPDGNVTVGIGHKLGGVEDASELPFEFQPGKERSDLEAAVRSDFATALTWELPSSIRNSDSFAPPSRFACGSGWRQNRGARKNIPETSSEMTRFKVGSRRRPKPNPTSSIRGA